MGDPWPMIAGVGAGIAAAAAVGQMIVAAVSLGNEDATEREVQALKSRLEAMQKKLEDNGYLAESNTDKAVAAKERVLEIESFEDLTELAQSLDQKVKGLDANAGGDGAGTSGSSAKSAQKGALTRYFEDRGRKELPFQAS